LAAPPAGPLENWVYKDSDNGIVYIYNGSAWEVMVYDGYSVHIAYCNYPPDSKPAKPTGAGTTDPWFTDSSLPFVWMSQAVALGTPVSADWSEPILVNPQSAGDPSLVPSLPCRRWKLISGLVSANEIEGIFPATLHASNTKTLIITLANGNSYTVSFEFTTYGNDNLNSGEISRFLETMQLTFVKEDIGISCRAYFYSGTYYKVEIYTEESEILSVGGTLATAVHLDTGTTNGNQWVKNFYEYSENDYTNRTFSWSTGRVSSSKWIRTKRAVASSDTWPDWEIEPLAGDGSEYAAMAMNEFIDNQKTVLGNWYEAGGFRVLINETWYELVVTPVAKGSYSVHDIAYALDQFCIQNEIPMAVYGRYVDSANSYIHLCSPYNIQSVLAPTDGSVNDWTSSDFQLFYGSVTASNNVNGYKDTSVFYWYHVFNPASHESPPTELANFPPAGVSGDWSLQVYDYDDNWRQRKFASASNKGFWNLMEAI